MIRYTRLTSTCTYVLVFLILAGHESNSEDEFLRVVIVKDAVEVLAKVSADLVSDLLHCQLLVRHSLSVQFKTEEPGGDTGRVKVGHFIVDIDKLLIFRDDSVLGFWIVVNCCVGRDLTQSGVLNATEDILKYEDM